MSTTIIIIIAVLFLLNLNFLKIEAILIINSLTNKSLFYKCLKFIALELLSDCIRFKCPFSQFWSQSIVFNSTHLVSQNQLLDEGPVDQEE